VTATDAPTTTNGAQAELVYRYADDAGTLRYEVIRRPPKKFLQRRPDPTGKNGWTWDLDNVTRIPYRLVNLTIAAENGLTAWVVEGEKDVERLIGLGLTATTNAGGAKWPWPDEWAEHFRGLHQAIVIADNDDPGRTAALQRAKVIARTVPDVRFVAIDWALSVSTGSWWFGQQVVKGRVLYVVAEGAVGVPQRVDAWKHARRTWSLGDIIWLPVPVDIFHAGHALDVARLARELNPTLIVIDTLARSVPTADENSAKDMGQVVLNADRLRRATGACVLVVHHTGRDEARGMRGSTVLEGAMDTTLECRKNEDGAVEITSTKQKNSQSGQRLRFAMAKERDSLVLAEWRGDQTDEIGVTAEAMLTTLHEIDTGEGVTATIWLETSGQPKKTFYRWRKKLLDLDLVSSQGAGNQKRFSVTEEGLVAIGVVEMELPEQF
jgi:hypothetical protein